MADEKAYEREGVFPGSGNVLADLNLPDPEARMAKAQMAHAIRSRIREYGLSQTQAAEHLNTTQARVSEIMSGKVGKMSYEFLLDYINVLECDVQITIVPRRQAASSRTAPETVPAPERGHVLVATS